MAHLDMLIAISTVDQTDTHVDSNEIYPFIKCLSTMSTKATVQSWKSIFDPFKITRLNFLLPMVYCKVCQSEKHKKANCTNVRSFTVWSDQSCLL